MQFGVKAREVVRQALTVALRERIVIFGYEMFPLELGVAGEDRRSIVNTHVGNRHRQRRSNDIEQGGFFHKRSFSAEMAGET